MIYHQSATNAAQFTHNFKPAFHCPTNQGIRGLDVKLDVKAAIARSCIG